MTAGIALNLALSGSFAQVAEVSAVARLIAYAGTAGATLQLRRLERRGQTALAAADVISFGALVPALALVTSLLILRSDPRAARRRRPPALLAGAALFVVVAYGRRAR